MTRKEATPKSSYHTINEEQYKSTVSNFSSVTVQNLQAVPSNVLILVSKFESVPTRYLHLVYTVYNNILYSRV